MNVNIKQILWILLGVGLLYHCANPLSPVGGPDDKTPPELDVSNSTPNLKTNVRPEKIELKFDEWVVVRNPGTEIIVSPPLAYRPKVGTKGKGVVLEFDEREVLRDSTTYVINFGESIQDLTAGNAFKDFTFVFSTGNQLDKQKIGGKVIDAYTGEPAKGAIVALYDEIQDSVIFKQRPVYYANVKDDGSFLIDYLREDTFLVFAIVDANRNYYWDQETELFGYYPESINTRDTFNNKINFSIYQRKKSSRILQSDDDQKGKFKILTSGDGAGIDISVRPEPSRLMKRIEEDSIVLYIAPVDSNYTIYANYGEQMDTLKYKPSSKQKESKLHIDDPDDKQVVKVGPSRITSLEFNLPIRAYDLDAWVVVDTSDNVYELSLTSTDSLSLKWELQIQDDRTGPQKLMILPGGLIDFYSRPLEDTLYLNYTMLTTEDVSVMNIEIGNLDSSQQYIVQLIQEEKIIETYKIEDASSKKWQITNLIPGQYTLHIIEDVNKNGKWNGGDYFKRTESEKILRKKVEPLRANWDVEVLINWR